MVIPREAHGVTVSIDFRKMNDTPKCLPFFK